MSEPGKVELVLITGFSGAGKSEAMAAFEDNGYFCIDNLPPRLIATLGELFEHEGSKVERAAIASDVRGGAYFDDLLGVLDELAASGIALRLVFLEAEEQTLLDRYKETRRRHPMAPEGRVTDGIRGEQELLAPLRERADLVIDTTGMTGAMLRRRVAEEVIQSDAAGRLSVTIISFGFKNGPPRDADIVLDVRFLPNPHYEPELRWLTGRDQPVIDYVEAGEKIADFYGHLLPLLAFLVPSYIAEGKTHLTVAFGCTGGRHRSVCIADRIERELGLREDVLVNVVHRDAGFD